MPHHESLHMCAHAYPLCASQYSKGDTHEEWIHKHLQHLKVRVEDPKEINRVEKELRVNNRVSLEVVRNIVQGKDGNRCCRPLWLLKAESVQRRFEDGPFPEKSLMKAQHIPWMELDSHLAHHISQGDNHKAVNRAVNDWNQSTGDVTAVTQGTKPEAPAESPLSAQPYSSATFRHIASQNQTSHDGILSELRTKPKDSLRKSGRETVDDDDAVDMWERNGSTRSSSVHRKPKRRRTSSSEAPRTPAQVDKLAYLEELAASWGVKEERITELFGDVRTNTLRVAKKLKIYPFDQVEHALNQARQRRITKLFKRRGVSRKETITPGDIEQALKLLKRRASATEQDDFANVLDRNTDVGTVAVQQDGYVSLEADSSAEIDVAPPTPVSILPSMQFKKSLQRLLSGQLNDEAINATLELIERIRGRSTVRVILSHAMTRDPPDLRQYQDIGSAIVILPVHVSSHWVVTVIDSTRSLALVYDSKPYASHLEVEPIVHRFCDALGIGCLPVQFSSRLLQEPQDSENCGVYALINVLHSVLPSPIRLDHTNTELWRHIFYRLLRYQPSDEDPPLAPAVTWPWPERMSAVLTKETGNHADLIELQRCLKATYKNVSRQTALLVQYLQEAASIMKALSDSCATEDQTIQRRLAEVQNELELEVSSSEQKLAEYLALAN